MPISNPYYFKSCVLLQTKFIATIMSQLQYAKHGAKLDSCNSTKFENKK